MEQNIKLEKELYLEIFNNKNKKFDEYFENAREISEYYYINETKEELASLECRIQDLLIMYLRTKLGNANNVLNNYECTYGTRDYY